MPEIGPSNRNFARINWFWPGATLPDGNKRRCLQQLLPNPDRRASQERGGLPVSAPVQESKVLHVGDDRTQDRPEYKLPVHRWLGLRYLRRQPPAMGRWRLST